MSSAQAEKIAGGGVDFHVEYRVFGGDRGAAVRVYGDVEGRPVQLLRFDCFEKDPHYHFDPDGKNIELRLNPDTVPDPIAWTLGELRVNLRPMLRAAGYAAIAERLDRDAAAAAVDRVEAALRTAIEGHASAAA